MKNEEIKQLVELLRQLKSKGLTPPNTPFEVWKELVGITPAPAVEVLLTSDGKDFLLTWRQDSDWNGWHIPGGFMGPGESVEQACVRVSLRELGIKVKMEKLLMVEAWKDHPYAKAVSIVCVCSSKEKPEEGQFFYKVPEETISQHKLFLEEFIKQKR